MVPRARLRSADEAKAEFVLRSLHREVDLLEAKVMRELYDIQIEQLEPLRALQERGIGGGVPGDSPGPPPQAER